MAEAKEEKKSTKAKKAAKATKSKPKRLKYIGPGPAEATIKGKRQLVEPGVTYPMKAAEIERKLEHEPYLWKEGE